MVPGKAWGRESPQDPEALTRGREHAAGTGPAGCGQAPGLHRQQRYGPLGGLTCIRCEGPAGPMLQDLNSRSAAGEQGPVREGSPKRPFWRAAAGAAAAPHQSSGQNRTETSLWPGAGGEEPAGCAA